MQVVPFPSRRVRDRYRHELRSLTYVTLDAVDSGVIRNLNSKGLRLQTVCALQMRQRVRLQFNLRFPRLRVEADGEVAWIDPSGFCGIRFVDLPLRLSHKIDEWIFANLLETIERHSNDPSWIFRSNGNVIAREEISSSRLDGLTLSSAARAPILLDQERGAERSAEVRAEHLAPRLNWLSRPVSPATMARVIDVLLVLAALLMFIFIFVSIAHELPSLWVALSGISIVSILLVVAYWSLFAAFGSGTFGARLMQLGLSRADDKSDLGRFR